MIIIFALLGAAVGSFLNVCVDRLPGGQSLLRPPSHCVACGRRLAPLDLIPVVSYLWIRGRCRYCGAAIPIRLLLVELGTAVVFALLWWNYGFAPELFMSIFYSCLFFLILVIDLEHGLILNKVVFPAMVISLGLASLHLDSGITDPGIVAALIGGATGLAILLLPIMVWRHSMGWGDVKLAALIGLVTGFPYVFLALFIAIVGGGLVASALLLLKLKRSKEGIPFGPFLSLGALITIFWGTAISQWYQSLFGMTSGTLAFLPFHGFF